MKTRDATSIVVLAGGAVAIYFLYTWLKGVNDTTASAWQGVQNANDALVCGVESGWDWLKNEVGVSSCGQ